MTDGPAPVALGGRLPHRAEAEDVVAQAGGDRRDRVGHRAELAGQLDAAGEPVEVQPQRLLDLGDAGAREARRDRHVAGVGGDAVDVVAGEAGVLDGGEATRRW